MKPSVTVTPGRCHLRGGSLDRACCLRTAALAALSLAVLVMLNWEAYSPSRFR
ncbi:MAG: hypothetical protein ACT4PQ_11960 [Betaproteobacteria bacterium]